jgi:hypothetical protein
MIQNILNECWKNWEEDHHPIDRRMTVVEEKIGTPDMSVENTRFLINEIVRRVGGIYLEVGVWVGHSLMSAAMYNDDIPCVGIENFSAHPDKARLAKSLESMPNNVTMYNGSYVDILPQMEDYAGEITVYYYDADHSHLGTLLGLYMALPLLAPKSYILLDDLTLNQVRHAKNRFVNANIPNWEEVFCVVPPKELVIKKAYRNWFNGFSVLERV